MLKYCYEKWNKNRDILEAKLRKIDLSQTYYEELLTLTVECILNDDEYPAYSWDTDNITEIDNCWYQGTLLFLIPRLTCQPTESDYLMTCIGYGSCSVCDTLQRIQANYDDLSVDEQIKEFMALCKDFITNMIKPYNYGWRNDEEFEHISMEDN